MEAPHMSDKFDRQSVEYVHWNDAEAHEIETVSDFEDKADRLSTVEEAVEAAVRIQSDERFEAVLEDWHKRLSGIKVDANSAMLFRQLRENGIIPVFMGEDLLP
jgi:hypothetical protein